jgi:hypothetical protein
VGRRACSRQRLILWQGYSGEADSGGRVDGVPDGVHPGHGVVTRPAVGVGVIGEGRPAFGGDTQAVIGGRVEGTSTVTVAVEVCNPLLAVMVDVSVIQLVR